MVEIREATVENAEAISCLAYELSARYIVPDFTPKGREMLLNSMTKEKIRKYMKDGFRYHVAAFNDQVIGVIAIRDNSHLYHLFVNENFQRQGIATCLWETVRDICLATGNSGRFTVNASLNARPVYERFGFVTTSSIQDQNGVITIPMKLFLDS